MQETNRQSCLSGARASGAVSPALAGGATPPGLNVIDRYCSECFAPSGSEELCQAHRNVACERCGRQAVVKELGAPAVCVSGRCLAWARGAA